MDILNQQLTENLPLNEEPQPSDDSIETITPDNPPWSSLSAFLIWCFSVALLFIIGGVAVLIYAAVNNDGDINTAINNSSDPNLLLVGLLSTFPVHFITLAVVWLTVTNAGKYSFWKTLGWNWGKNFSFWKSVIIAVVFYLLAVLLVSLFGETENDLMRVLRSSRAAVYATAFLATFTAPLVEETVYRGMMYSAFRRNFGNWAAIALVTVLFALIHVPQYYPSYGVILAILLLSFVLSIVRAYSGNLLPCVVIHTVFNGIQAIMLILEPFIMKTSAPPAEPAVFTLPFFFK